MKLSGMADALENQLRDPNADLAPFTDRIIEIVNTEWQEASFVKIPPSDVLMYRQLSSLVLPISFIT